MNIIMTNRKNEFLVAIKTEYPNCNISIDFDNYIRKGDLFQNTVR